jgi:hypothetical protein
MDLLRGIGLGKALVDDQSRLATLLAGLVLHRNILLAPPQKLQIGISHSKSDGEV